MSKWILAVLFLWSYSITQIFAEEEIIGGTAAHPKKFPAAARLGYRDKARNQTTWFCGGTLISKRVVLTAAHCFYTDIGAVNVVRLGELVFNSDKDDAQPEDFEVLKLKEHPSFNYPALYNDIGLVHLSRDVVFNAYKIPACLPYTSGQQLRYFIAIGWGLTHATRGQQSKELRRVDLQNFGVRCAQTTERNEDLPNGFDELTQLCVGSPQHKDTCNGDSGGPLLIRHIGQGCAYQVLGITSVGIACDTPGIPSLYTKVFFYLEWIRSEMNAI
ncbi:serine protease snake-like [Drosophila kikkawai]|uniref:Serine protease snake-like n=1 Tax=Drosophila kikkawai TaxID=30033 RepID=A0A6P4I5L1_DROKI|nr:serine protease snake-like [Drosophila kikkawai]